MQSTIMSETLGESYHQFLSDLGQAICDKISGDEDVAALNELQSKDYLLQKIHEIIESVYQAKNQQAFAQHIEQIEQQRVFIIEQQTQIKKLVEALSSQEFTNQNGPKDFENELQKQNWQLSKRLIEQDQQNKMRVKEFAQTIKIMERQQESARTAFSNELSSAIEGIKLWEEKYKSLYQQKNTIETALEQQVERHLQEQMRARELNQEKEELELSVQKMTKLNKAMREQADRLEDKVIRLEKNKESLEQQIKTYQEEIKAVKKVNEQLNDKQGSGKERKGSLGEAKELIKNLREVQEQQERAETEERLRRMFELEKKVEKNKQAKQQTELQFHEYKLSAQKRIFELEQEVNELRIRHEKQIRIMKQGFIKEKESLNESNEQRLNDIQQSASQNSLEQLKQMQVALKASEDKLTKSKSQLKDLEAFMQEKEVHYTESLQEVQKKNEELRGYIRQLEKTLREKSTSSSDLLKEYGLKVEACQQEVGHYKRENEKLRREIEGLRKELEKASLSLMSQKSKEAQGLSQRKLNDYRKEDYEQYIKEISQLKQKILVMSNEEKFSHKESQSRGEAIEQLKARNSKLQQKGQKYKEELSRLQRQLSSSRKELTQLQTSHHKELGEVYKSNEARIEGEKKQLKGHYEELLKNREERLDQCRNSTVIYEHQLTINSLRNNIQSLRDKNLAQQHKIQSLTLNIKELNKQLTVKDKNAQHDQQQHNQLSKQLFTQKQQNVNLQKHLREKLQHNQLIFRQFKFEIDAYLRTELAQLREMAKATIRTVADLKSWFNQIKEKFTIQFYSQSTAVQSDIKHSIKTIKSHYEHQVNITHKLTLQQLQQQFNQKLKQHQVQTMAQIASRQFHLKQQQKQIHSLQNLKDKLELTLKIKSQETQKLKEDSRIFKEVHDKATDKATKLEKLLIQTQQDLQTSTSENTHLKSQMNQLQQMYQTKLDQTRQKYIQENQKLFYKYEKEFDKLITMNAKVKNTALSSMMFNTVAPTKESDLETRTYEINTLKSIPNAKSKQKFDSLISDSKKEPVSEKKESSKLQNIKKEIMLQKKKLQSLDSTKKIPTKGYASSSNLIKSKKAFD